MGFYTQAHPADKWQDWDWYSGLLKVKVLVTQVCLTVGIPKNCSPPGSPGKNTGVGSHSLLQGIIPTQGSNPGLLHCKWILYHLSHQSRLFFFCLKSVSTLSLYFHFFNHKTSPLCPSNNNWASKSFFIWLELQWKQDLFVL